METTRTGTNVQFATQGQGLELLKLLSDLAMRAGHDLWVSSGLFLTANSILLVALFNGSNSAVWAIAIIAIFGLLLSFTWMVVIRSAKWREDLWRKKAYELQSKLGIPSEIAPWGERFYLGVELTKSKTLRIPLDMHHVPPGPAEASKSS